MSYRYRVYGLNYESPYPVSGLVPIVSDAPWMPDVRCVHILDIPLHHQRPQKNGACISKPTAADRCWRVYDEEGRLTEVVELAEDGSQITAYCGADRHPANIAEFCFHPGLGFAARLLGRLCLHASVQLVDGAAVLLMGPSGAGKSTMSAVLWGLGFPVLSDDVAAIQFQGGEVWVEPGRARISLLGNSPAWESDKVKSQKVTQAFCDEGQNREETKQTIDLTAPEGAALAKTIVILSRESGLSVPSCQLIPDNQRIANLRQNVFGSAGQDIQARKHEWDQVQKVSTYCEVRRLTWGAGSAQLNDALAHLV